MLIPLLLIAGLAVGAYDYVSTHQDPPADLRSRPLTIQRDRVEYPGRGHAHTEPVLVTSTVDAGGFHHMEINPESLPGIPVDR